MDSETDIKVQIRNRFNTLAQARDRWIERNRYYYEDQQTYFRFLIPENSSILELGCGTGNLLASLNPKRGLGIDISAEMISVARSKFPEIEFRVGVIENLEGLKAFQSEMEEPTSEEEKSVKIIRIDGRKPLDEIAAQLKKEIKNL